MKDNKENKYSRNCLKIQNTLFNWFFFVHIFGIIFVLNGDVDCLIFKRWRHKWLRPPCRLKSFYERKECLKQIVNHNSSVFVWRLSLYFWSLYQRVMIINKINNYIKIVGLTLYQGWNKERNTWDKKIYQYHVHYNADSV